MFASDIFCGVDMKPSSVGTGASTPFTLGILRRIGGSDCASGVGKRLTPEELGSFVTARCCDDETVRGSGGGPCPWLLAPIPLRTAGIPDVDVVRGGGATARWYGDDALCIGGIGGIGGGCAGDGDGGDCAGSDVDDVVRVIAAGGGGVRDDRGPCSDGFGGGTEPREPGGFDPVSRPREGGPGGDVGTSFVRAWLADGGALLLVGFAGGGRVTAFIAAVDTLAGAGGGARTPLAA